MSKCNIVFKGAYTARIINGVSCCPSCGKPTKEHKKFKGDK